MTENLTHSRLEIHGISCTGPALKKFTNSTLNLETLSQKLSSLVFFPTAKNCEFLSDMTFNKNPLIIFGKNSLVKEFQKRKLPFLKKNHLKEAETLTIQFIPKSQLKTNSLNQFHFPLLVAEDINLKELKSLFSLYTTKPLFFIISEKNFNENIFQASYYEKGSLLKNLGDLFDNKTRLIVASKNNKFESESFKNIKGSSVLKDYLLKKKQILKL